jgi:glycerol-3-phosphate O-acyltransferase/dihydroxyacetone phosphate acyltransferase
MRWRTEGTPRPAERRDMASPFVRWLASAACWIFYRVDRAGDVPASGAMLLLPNHPNGLLDPAIVWATAKRDVRFLAKSTLFHSPLRPLLAGAGAIPVYRRLDQGVDVSKNAETFAAVDAALAAGDAICVFPEGISHSSGRLEPLRTGAARMALSAERQGTRVVLVPVGLNFDRKTAFRSRVTVVYGRTFSCADLLTGERQDQFEPVRALTDRITERLRNLLVEADPVSDAALVERIDRLYAAARGRPSDAEDRVARRRAIAAGMERLRAVDPHRYEEIFLKFRRYNERLQRFGLRDRHLDWQVSTGDAVRFAVRELLWAIVLMPIALVSLLLFAIPYFVTNVIARRAAKYPDIEATAKLVAGAVVYIVWTTIVAAVMWNQWGAAAGLATVVAVPVTAVAGLLALERETAVRDAIRAWLLLRRTGGETRERLRKRRSELADVLDEVHEMLQSESVRDKT